MRNITKAEFQLLCEDVFSKTRENLFQHAKEEIKKVDLSKPPRALYELFIAHTDNVFDASCRYTQELLEILFFDDNSEILSSKNFANSDDS